MHSRCFILIFLQIVLLSSAANAVELVLKSNPFERPLMKDKSKADQKTSAQAALPSMKLRATMAAGTDSLANIGGEILGIGQQINGYTLLAVHPRHVVLEKNEIQKTLSIDNDTEKKQ